MLVPRFYDGVRRPTEAEEKAIAEQGHAMEEQARATHGIRSSLDNVTGAAYRERISFAPTANVAGIHGGYDGPGMKTVLVAEARAWVDFRLVPNQHPDRILELLRDHLQREGFDDIEVSALGSSEAAGTPIEHPLVRRVIRAAEEASG